jgi:hypothetical protein
MNPGSASEAMPTGIKVGISEATAYFKEIAATTIVDANLLQRLASTQAKAADDLAMELDATALNVKRTIARDFYGDGTGIVVRAKSVSVTDGAAGTGKVTVTAALPGETVDSLATHGSITFLEEGMILAIATKAGVAVDVSGDTAGIYAWKVSLVDVDAGTFVVKPVASDLVTELAIEAASGDSNQVADNFVAGTCFYNLSQIGAFPNQTSLSDYGTASKMFVGIESLSAHDGRLCNGLTMSGLFAGSRRDCGGDLITIDDIQGAMSLAKRRVGQGAASWNNVLMHDKVWDVFVLSTEDDRRFYAKEDAGRGSKTFVFQHGKDALEFIVSEFCPINRAYSLPVNLKGGKAVEMHMTDIVSQKSPDNGNPWVRKVNSSGVYTKQFESFSSGFLQMVAHQPAAIVALENFTLS